MKKQAEALRQTCLGTKERADAFAVLLLTVSVFLSFYTAIVASLVIAVAVMLDDGRRRRLLAIPYARLLLGFLIVPFFVAAMYNNLRGILVSFVLYAIIICGLLLRSVMTRALFGRMLDWACCCSVGCALLAVGQKLVYWPVMPEYRPVSTFTNANYYGAVVEIMLLVCFFRFQTNRQSRGWYLVAAAANLCGLYLTGSMSSAIAACAGIFVYLLLQRRRSLVIWFCILAAAAAVLITYFPALFPRVENVGTAWDQRFSIWMTALHGILEHPLLGQGASAYEMIAPQLGGYLTYHCHNLLLDTLLNFGFVGLGVFLVFGLQQARLLWLRFRNRIGRPSNVLMTAAMAAVLVHGVTDVTVFWSQTSLLLLMVLSSLSVGAEFLERELSPRPRRVVSGSAVRLTR